MRLQHTLTPGYTNLHAGMREIERHYMQSHHKQTLAIILSDGISNYGPQPNHKDFFLPQLLMLCFQKKESIDSIAGFSPSIIRSIHQTDPLPFAFHKIYDYIIEYSHEEGHRI